MHEHPQARLDEAARARLEGTQLVALDVDGVLTDGRIVYGEEEELQRFDVKDGAALVWLRAEGIRLAWITGRGCAATARRARELGVDRLLTRSGPKHVALAALQEEWDVLPEHTVAMGDDLPDLGLAQRAGFFAAPADACGEVRERADWVSRARGGRGAVRELAELILRARGAWQGVVDGYAC